MKTPAALCCALLGLLYSGCSDPLQPVTSLELELIDAHANPEAAAAGVAVLWTLDNDSATDGYDFHQLVLEPLPTSGTFPNLSIELAGRPSIALGDEPWLEGALVLTSAAGDPAPEPLVGFFGLLDIPFVTLEEAQQLGIIAMPPLAVTYVPDTEGRVFASSVEPDREMLPGFHITAHDAMLMKDHHAWMQCFLGTDEISRCGANPTGESGPVFGVSTPGARHLSSGDRFRFELAGPDDLLD